MSVQDFVARPDKGDPMRFLILIVICIIPYASVLAQDHSGHKKGSEKLTPEFTRFMMEMDVGMKKMMDNMHAPGYSGDPDLDFLAMMIPHHEGAVEMSRLVLIYGRDPLVRRLAEDIIAGQQVEIETMKLRLMILRSSPDPEPGGFPALGGTRGQVDTDK
jgi:hypothetical protein